MYDELNGFWIILLYLNFAQKFIFQTIILFFHVLLNLYTSYFIFLYLISPSLVFGFFMKFWFVYVVFAVHKIVHCSPSFWSPLNLNTINIQILEIENNLESAS